MGIMSNFNQSQFDELYRRYKQRLTDDCELILPLFEEPYPKVFVSTPVSHEKFKSSPNARWYVHGVTINSFTLYLVTNDSFFEFTDFFYVPEFVDLLADHLCFFFSDVHSCFAFCSTYSPGHSFKYFLCLAWSLRFRQFMQQYNLISTRGFCYKDYDVDLPLYFLSDDLKYVRKCIK